MAVAAPFNECPIVPGAVPESRRPSTPALSGSVDPDRLLSVLWAGFWGAEAAGRAPTNWRSAGPGGAATRFVKVAEMIVDDFLA